MFVLKFKPFLNSSYFTKMNLTKVQIRRALYYINIARSNYDRSFYVVVLTYVDMQMRENVRKF